MNNEFFSLPLFPQQSYSNGATESASFYNGQNGAANTYSAACSSCTTSSCSSCGTACVGSCSQCPRCGCTMTLNS